MKYCLSGIGYHLHQANDIEGIDRTVAVDIRALNLDIHSGDIFH